MSDPSPGVPGALQVIVAVGELAAVAHPSVLITQALGSCVGLTLWDPLIRVGGMAHIMLPSASDSALEGHPTRFATRAVPMLVQRMVELGSPRRRLVAKLAGGAAMFGGDSGIATIGDRNTAEVREQLKKLGIPVRAEDTGGSHARTIELRLDTGILLVRSYVYGLREI
jgi:chemotaxis protein CheD